MMRTFSTYMRRNHLALLALFVALGGTAFAAGKINGSQIAKNAVKGKHVAKNALTGGDIREGTLAVGKTLKNARSTGGPYTSAGPIPLEDGTFTQKAGETAMVLASVQMSATDDCGAYDPSYNPGAIVGKLYLDGDQIVNFNANFAPGGPGEYTKSSLATVLVASDEASESTLTAEVTSSFCPGGGSSQVDFVAVDVLGSR